jgi:hypothetical protein
MTLLVAFGTFAEPPANVAPDPQLQQWFKALRQPGTGQLCCAISNCRLVPFGIRDEHYEVTIDGWTYVVPAERIIDGIANPTGKAVACYQFDNFGPPLPAGAPRDHPQDTAEILCFIPPRPSS